MRPAGPRVTRTCQRRPSAWVTMTSQPSSTASGTSAHSAARRVSPRLGAHVGLGALRRTGERRSGPGRGAGRAARPAVPGLARSEDPLRRPLVEAREGLSPGQEDRSRREAVTAGVRHLPRPARGDPRGVGGERASADGAADVAAAVGAHEQGRLSGACAEERGLRRGRGCRGRGRPSRVRAGRRRRSTSATSSQASSGRAPAWATKHVAGAVVRRVPSGAPDEHEAATCPARAALELGAELAVEVRLACRVAAPRAGLLDDDEEARRGRRAVGARAVVVPEDRAGVGGRGAVAGRRRVLGVLGFGVLAFGVLRRQRSGDRVDDRRHRSRTPADAAAVAAATAAAARRAALPPGGGVTRRRRRTARRHRRRHLSLPRPPTPRRWTGTWRVEPRRAR